MVSYKVVSSGVIVTSEWSQLLSQDSIKLDPAKLTALLNEAVQLGDSDLSSLTNRRHQTLVQYAELIRDFEAVARLTSF